MIFDDLWHIVWFLRALGSLKVPFLFHYFNTRNLEDLGAATETHHQHSRRPGRIQEVLCGTTSEFFVASKLNGSTPSPTVYSHNLTP